MGASSWWYQVAYEDDPDASLQRLRRRVFEDGAYVLEPDPEIARASGMVARDPGGFARMVAGERPLDIDEALAWAAPGGTHSVLDVDYVSTPRDDGGMRALDDDELVAVFGTARPAVDDVLALADELVDLAVADGVGGGVYLVGYERDEPASYFFVGASGD